MGARERVTDLAKLAPVADRWFDGYEYTGAGDRYVLTAPLVWEVGRRGSGWMYVVPAGFAFDLSVPRLLTWLVSRHYRAWLLPAALHDHLLAQGFDYAFAGGEWRRAADFFDPGNRLNLPALLGITLWTRARRA